MLILEKVFQIVEQCNLSKSIAIVLLSALLILFIKRKAKIWIRVEFDNDKK